MFRRFDSLTGHIAVLIAVWALVCLPNLGKPSLWDGDEGWNGECSREMRAAGNWVVPTFNYQLRTDKPALLYWLQIAAYSVFGVNELAARLPSALASLITLLAVYALGRRMFAPQEGLLAALVLATSPAFVGAAHFGNPDALLLATTTLALTLFWGDYQSDGKGWLVGVGIAAGLGVLAKGPVGFVLPAAVAGLFLLCQGQLRRLLDFRVLTLLAACVLVAAPWYAWVAAETRGLWVKEFWFKHNVARASAVMESHGGPVFYYLLVLVPGLLPWSIFLIPTCWRGWAARREPATCFLLLWAGVYLLFFSLARTKLPNYVLPAYPALALLTARFLTRWARGEESLPAWAERLGLTGLAAGGAAVVVGLLVAGGALPVPGLRVRTLDGLHLWAWVGLVPAVAAAVASWQLDRGRRDQILATLVIGGGLFVAIAAGLVMPSVDAFKAPRPLAAALPADLSRQDARIAAWGYFQPSLVFYCRREVQQVGSLDGLLAHLGQGHPAYAFLPEQSLPAVLEHRRVRVLASHVDLNNGRRVVLVANH